MKVFYLGIHRPGWLSVARVPLCVSYVQLRVRRSYPTRALGDDGRPVEWVIDSGAYTELSRKGEWTVPPGQYAEYVKEIHSRKIGLAWAGIQDWMCERNVRKKTGLTVADHQRLTIDNYEALLKYAPRAPWAPTLQGARPEDYLAHFEQYLARGHDLRKREVVGVGSVCRQQRTRKLVETFEVLRPLGLRLHGYGVKQLGLARVGHLLQSSDSMAWSSHAFYNHLILPGHEHGGRKWRKRIGRVEYGNCANCLVYALKYYRSIHRRFVDVAEEAGRVRSRGALRAVRPSGELDDLPRRDRPRARPAAAPRVAGGLRA